jgi:hypothetical protein
MNARRGFFRVWIAVSVLWACLLAVIFYSDALKYTKPIHLTVAKYELEFPGTTSRETIRLALITFLTQKKPSDPSLAQSDVGAAASEIATEFRYEDFPEFALRMTLLLILIPGILFVAGWAILWVFAGFRKDGEIRPR